MLAITCVQFPFLLNVALLTGTQTGQAAGGDGTTPADPAQVAAATPAAGAGSLPQQGTEAYQQYAAYWAAYGYDVNDPQCESHPWEEVV